MTGYATSNFESSLTLYHFAAAYNCGAYGSGSYNESQNCSTSTTSAPTTNSSSGLADTGQSIYLIAGIVLVLFAVALAITLALRRKK